jgi:hypothetical protein
MLHTITRKNLLDLAYLRQGKFLASVGHTVVPIDPNIRLDWSEDDGRRMILPVIIRSDYDTDPKTNPRSVG